MTDAELETLRSAWAAVPGARAAGCAPAEEIWEAVAGRRPEERVRALLDHSLGCAECSSLWRVAHDLVAASGVPPTERPRVAPIRPALAWLAGAAMLAAAAVATFALLPTTGRRHGPPMVRGTKGELLRPDPGTRTLDRGHPVLRWTGAPAGTRYTVTMSTRDLTILFRSGVLTAPQVELPPDALASVPPGSDVVWRVEATLPGGERIGSGAFLSRVE